MTAVVLAVCGRRFTVVRGEHRPEAVTAQACAQVGGAAIVLLVLAILDLIGSGGVTRLRTRSAVVALRVAAGLPVSATAASAAANDQGRSVRQLLPASRRVNRKSHRCSAKMPAMKGKSGRRYRPRSSKGVVMMSARMPESARAQANEVADSLGITLGEYIENLICRVEVDANGRPVWADEVVGASVPTEPLPGLEATPAA